MNVTIHQGDARQKLAEIPDNSIDCVVLHAWTVELTDQLLEFFHLVGNLLRSARGALVAPAFRYAHLLTFVLELSQLQTNISLSSFDLKEWPQGFEASSRFSIGHLPNEQRFSSLCIGVVHTKPSTKGVLEHRNSLGANLLYANPLTENRRTSILGHSHCVSAALDSNSSVGVNDASHISKLCPGCDHCVYYTLWRWACDEPGAGV